MSEPKILIIYYSLEGNTRFIAETIVDETKGEIIELKPKQELRSKGFMKYVWGGRQVVTKQTPELFPLETNPADYDLLFIGSPVWAFSYAPALHTFFKTNPVSGKRIALFCCNEGGLGKTFEKMKEALTGNEFVGEQQFIAPLTRNRAENERKAKEWAAAILDKSKIK